MINSLKLNFFKYFIKFHMGAVMEDCRLISLSYLYGKFDEEIFPFIRETSWKKLKVFMFWKSEKSLIVVKSSMVTIKVYKTFCLDTSLMYDGVVIHGVLIYMYIMYNDI